MTDVHSALTKGEYIRIAALSAAARINQESGSGSHTLRIAKDFENFIRGGK